MFGSVRECSEADRRKVCQEQPEAAIQLKPLGLTQKWIWHQGCICRGGVPDPWPL